MRSIVLTILLALCSAEATAQSSAQPPTPASQSQALRKSRIKIWTGIAMISAGAVMAPLTATSDRSRNGGVLGSVGLMGVGSGLVYWGFRQQQKAVQPSITFGVTVGRNTGVVVRRSW